MPETGNVKTICVCGAGTMGSGIAQVAAQAGFKTIQFDLNETMLEKVKPLLLLHCKSLLKKIRLPFYKKKNF